MTTQASAQFVTALGDLAQLVEHLLCKQDVRGSTPLVSTLGLQRCPTERRDMSHTVIHLHKCYECATLVSDPPNSYGNAYCGRHKPTVVASDDLVELSA